MFQGNAVFHSHTGLSEQRTYVDGVCHGPATLTTPQVILVSDWSRLIT